MGKKRLTVLAAAIAVAAACAFPALSRAQGPVTARSTAPPGGWTLTLQGKSTKVLPIDKFPTAAAWDGTKAGNINPSLRYVYKGQPLSKLVGLVDGGGAGFDVAKAKKGYKIKLFCLDGYTPSLSSKILFKNGKLRTTWIVAKIKAGQAPARGRGRRSASWADPPSRSRSTTSWQRTSS